MAATVAGGAAAVAARRRLRQAEAERRRGECERARRAFVAAVGDVLADRRELASQLHDVAAAAVPGVADLCVIDLVGPDGTIRPAAVEGADVATAALLARVRDRTPLPRDGEHPVAVALRSGHPQLLRSIEGGELSRYASSPSHLDFMRRTGYQSVVVAPLAVDDQRVGVISLIRTGRRPEFDGNDVAMGLEVARRLALSVDRARLFGLLADREAELRAVLESLAEAVTVQGPDGRVLYGNQAAVRLLDLPPGADIGREDTASLWTGWEVTDEHGGPLSSECLPGRRVLAGDPAPEPVLLRAVHPRTGEVRWRLVKASPVMTGDRARLAVNIIEDVTEAKRDELNQRFLAQASKLLSSSLDVQVTLEKVAWAAVPELADWCAVDMPDDEDGRLHRVATADVNHERLHAPDLVLGRSTRVGDMAVGPPAVMRSGRPELYSHVDDALLRLAAADDVQLAALRKVGSRSVLVVPLLAGGRVIGTLSMGTTVESGRRLGPRELEVAEELGRRAGVAVNNARLHGERSTVAATLQEALLPPRLPAVPRLSVAARFHAAGETSQVGGDFYDLFAVGDDWFAVMGDVTGKGPAAASITALARYTVRTAARYERSPARVLERLNEALVTDTEHSRLCTAVCARIHGRPRRGPAVRITVACGGHPPPLLATRAGTIEPAGVPGTLLGAFEAGEWSDVALSLVDGESLVLYTDGVTDARGRRDRFGPGRLERLVAQAARNGSAEQIAERIEAGLLSFQRGERRDDVALLVLRAEADVVLTPVAGTRAAA